MDLTQISDLHNRKNNIRAAARWFQERNLPLLAWPEDKLLLKVSDLPIIEGKPDPWPTWNQPIKVDSYILISDDDAGLREILQPGYGYSAQQINAYGSVQVTVWKINSRF